MLRFIQLMRPHIVVVALLLITLIDFSSTPPAEAAGPSFDCAKASTPVEKVICANPQLSSLDKEMADGYTHAIGSLSRDKTSVLVKEQREWLANRASVCKFPLTLDGPPTGPSQVSESCIADMYQRRIESFSRIVRLNGSEKPQPKLAAGKRMTTIRTPKEQLKYKTYLSLNDDLCQGVNKSYNAGLKDLISGSKITDERIDGNQYLKQYGIAPPPTSKFSGDGFVYDIFHNGEKRVLAYVNEALDGRYYNDIVVLLPGNNEDTFSDLLNLRVEDRHVFHTKFEESIDNKFSLHGDETTLPNGGVGEGFYYLKKWPHFKELMSLHGKSGEYDLAMLPFLSRHDATPVLFDNNLYIIVHSFSFFMNVNNRPGFIDVSPESDIVLVYTFVKTGIQDVCYLALTPSRLSVATDRLDH